MKNNSVRDIFGEMIEYRAIVRIQAVIRGFIARRRLEIINDLLRMDDEYQEESFWERNYDDDRYYTAWGNGGVCYDNGGWDMGR
jgi:hypothetical protein